MLYPAAPSYDLETLLGPRVPLFWAPSRAEVLAEQERIVDHCAYNYAHSDDQRLTSVDLGRTLAATQTLAGLCAHHPGPPR